MGRSLRAGTILVVTLTAAGCASTGAVPAPFPMPTERPPAATPGAGPTPSSSSTAPLATTGYAIAGTALSLRGSPYRDGGTDPAGFDCSGFVYYVFAQHGLPVPRTVGDQFRAGREVDPATIEAGDLVFFTTTTPGASHVGVSIGGDEFVHAPSHAGIVRVERLSGPYWSQRFVGARRLQ